MRRAEIDKTLKNGGRIVNRILVNGSNQPTGKVSDRQVNKLLSDGAVSEQVHYDKTRTYRPNT